MNSVKNPARIPASVPRPKFPSLFFLLVLLVTALALAGLTYEVWRAYHFASHIEKSQLKIQELHGSIVHYDEVLTMSANMAASTGDAKWEKRYYEYEPKLNEAINETIALAPTAYVNEAANLTDVANRKLTAMEKEAFDLIRDVRLEDAQAILSSSEYSKNKKLYGEGMERFIGGLHNLSHSSTPDQGKHFLLSIVIASLVLPFLIFAWIYAMKYVDKWRMALTESYQKLQESHTLLDAKASLDPLTDCHNRRGLQQILLRETKWAVRKHQELLALYVDIDDFKDINEKIGHAGGDIVIREIANKLRGSLRDTDYVARVGGDDFIALLPDTPWQHGVQLAERLRLNITETIIHTTNEETIQVTASISLAPVSEDVISINELLAEVQPILEQGRIVGKNRVSFHMKTKSAEEKSESDILTTLRTPEAFRAVKQEIMNLQERTPVGYEFLIRLNHEVYSTPNHFFRIALENNILTKVDLLSLRACLRSAKSLPEGGWFHFNLFPTTLVEIPAEQLLEELMEGRGAGTPCIEINEQQIIGEPTYLIDVIEALKKRGVCIALDDVGFGHSCLESLIILEPQIVKIDRKYVNRITDGPSGLRPLQRMLKVVENIGAEVIAEGIETEEQYKILKDLGVQYGQGYLFGMPK